MYTWIGGNIIEITQTVEHDVHKDMGTRMCLMSDTLGIASSHWMYAKRRRCHTYHYMKEVQPNYPLKSFHSHESITREVETEAMDHRR